MATRPCWGIDADGAPSRDPAAVLAGALLPFGGHKGSAISTMIEILAAVWIGDHLSSESSEADGGLAPNHGTLHIALDPAAFAATDRLAHAEKLLAAIRAQGARLPSERRYAARAAAANEGIAISQENLDRLQRMQQGDLDLELH